MAIWERKTWSCSSITILVQRLGFQRFGENRIWRYGMLRWEFKSRSRKSGSITSTHQLSNTCKIIKTFNFLACKETNGADTSKICIMKEQMESTISSIFRPAMMRPLLLLGICHLGFHSASLNAMRCYLIEILNELHVPINPKWLVVSWIFNELSISYKGLYFQTQHTHIFFVVYQQFCDDVRRNYLYVGCKVCWKTKVITNVIDSLFSHMPNPHRIYFLLEWSWFCVDTSCSDVPSTFGYVCWNRSSSVDASQWSFSCKVSSVDFWEN